jgi:hypothetical protein
MYFKEVRSQIVRKGNEGYNVSTGVYEDLVKVGSEEGHTHSLAERGRDCRPVADHRMLGH